jgi:hypothetical protein
MSAYVYGRPYTTAEAQATTVAQKFTPDENCLLKALRVTVIQYGDPSYTSVQARVYGDRAGLPGVLIATSSNSQTKANIANGVANSYSSIYFEFSTDISLVASEVYHLVLYVNGPTFTSDSYIAWVQDVYDPVYLTPQTTIQLYKTPYTCSFITSPL